jgi:hypothetical protein
MFIDEPEPMQQSNIGQDYTIRICPCGDSFQWSGFSRDLTGWTEEHKQHTNGYLEYEWMGETRKQEL